MKEEPKGLLGCVSNGRDEALGDDVEGDGGRDGEECDGELRGAEDGGRDSAGDEEGGKQRENEGRANKGDAPLRSVAGLEPLDETRLQHGASKTKGK